MWSRLAETPHERRWFAAADVVTRCEARAPWLRRALWLRLWNACISHGLHGN